MITVTMPLAEYEAMKRRIETLENESIRNFVRRDWTSTEEYKYRVVVDKDSILRKLSAEFDGAEDITFE